MGPMEGMCYARLWPPEHPLELLPAMRPRSLLALVGPILLVLPGCTSDLPAPSNYVAVADSGPANMLMVDCAALPNAAEGASFSYTPPTMGQREDRAYQFDAVDVPAGLEVDKTTGEITGTPDVAPGDYSFEITLSDIDDPDNYSASATCTLTVRRGLQAPLAIDTTPYCLRSGDSLLDLVVDGTGDGSEILCDAPGGSGNGRLPEGITVNETSCTIEGSLADDRYGTRVFIMRGQQSGAQVFVPYCVTNPDEGRYDITVAHSGIEDGTEVPLLRTFNPNAGFDVGGEMDPLFTIVDPTACGASSCFYGFAFSINGSPFDGQSFSLNPDGLLRDMDDNPIGFSHEMSVGGPPVEESFRDRPWVLNVSLDYCLADNGMACDGATSVRDNGEGNLEFGVVMVPEPA